MLVGKRLIFQHIMEQKIAHINTKCLTLGTLHAYKLIASKRTKKCQINQYKEHLNWLRKQMSHKERLLVLF